MPCQACGSMRRSHESSGDLISSEARIGLTLKAKHPGAKKAHVELRIGPNYSHSLGKMVEHRRLIDRTNDQYLELVRDYENGEDIHRSEEPLSLHVGHGSAKSRE